MTQAESAAKERPYSRKEVVGIIQSVITNVSGDNEITQKLKDELNMLREYIEGMRSELAQMRSVEISHNHIPSATDELDAVVEETAKATGQIMDACEVVEKVAETLDREENGELTGAVTKIYEACSFQDITGQRITKVVKALKKIEGKVGDILSAFGHETPNMKTTASNAADEDEGKLENGPQIGGPGINQDEIDKLLAEFDK